MQRIKNIWNRVDKETDNNLGFGLILFSWFVLTAILYPLGITIPGFTQIPPDASTISSLVIHGILFIINGFVYLVASIIVFIICFACYHAIKWVLKVIKITTKAVREEYEIEQPDSTSNSKITFS